MSTEPKMKNAVLSQIKLAFTRDPLIIPKHFANIVPEDPTFIKNTEYASLHKKEMIKGEIGIYNGRRLVVNLPIPRKMKRWEIYVSLVILVIAFIILYVTIIANGI